MSSARRRGRRSRDSYESDPYEDLDYRYAAAGEKTNDDLSRQISSHHQTIGFGVIVDMCIKFVVLLIVIAIVFMCGYLLLRNYHTHKDNKSCQPRGNDCLVGKLDNHGHCVQPAATKKHGAKCNSKCFVPESETNSSHNNHKCAKTYDLLEGHERTECIGSVPVGTCVEAEDCPPLLFNIDIDEGFSSGTQTRCDNGTCVWEVDPYIPYDPQFTPTGCSNDHVYRAHCDALLNNTQPLFGCLETTVLCRGATDDLYIVDNCRWEN